MARTTLLLAVLAVLASPSAATAAQPMLGLTTDGRVVRFDAASPGTIERSAALTGLRDGDSAMSVAAGADGLPWVLGSARRFYRLDPWTGQLRKSIELAEGARRLNPDPPAGPLSLAMSPWSSTYGHVAARSGDMWSTDVISAHTQPDPFSLQERPAVPPSLVAITGAAPGPPTGTRHFGLDAANDAVLAEGPYRSTATPLGFDAEAPAGLAAVSASDVLVATASGDRSAVHRLDTATGVVTPVGTTPPGVVLGSLMRIDPPTFSFETPTHFFTPSVHESSPEDITVRVVRYGDPEPATSVAVRIGGDGPYGNLGPAQPGEDYDPAPRSVSFAPGQRYADVPLTFFDDDVPEAMEDVGVTLEPAPGARVAPPGLGFSIHDDDTQVVENAYTVAEGAGPLALPIIRPPAGYLGLNVPWRVTGGTAASGQDFTIPPADVAFRPNQGRGELPVTTTDDSTAEGDETFTVTFGASARHRVTGVQRSVQVTIRDNDRPVVLRSSALSAATRHRLGRVLEVKVTCPQACSGTLDLLLDRRRARRAHTRQRLVHRVLGRSRTRERVVTLRLPGRATRRLRRVAPVRASLRLKLRSGTGVTAPLTRPLTLVR